MRIEEGLGQNGHAQPAKSAPTAEQILGEIRDFCRETQTAESTFGRLVVNDGKLVSREALDDFLARARGEAAVSRILLIAGDGAAAKGPFRSTGDVCASGLIEAHGISCVSLAGHPEGHPFLELRAAR